MTIPEECKRLIEVDFPVGDVSREAAREKSIRHGHPSTLHFWWARRPLAACRAVLMGLLLPDPCDSRCPPEFREMARSLMAGVAEPVKTNRELRETLLTFLADFADWDNSANTTYIEKARGLVKAAYGAETPLVVDPFAGGGSIPLESLRVGCHTFASDLNPVSCLLLKFLLEDIPRDGSKLAEEVRKVGIVVKETAAQELAAFYPSDPDGARPIAFLWARTVLCEAPNCGAEIPVYRSQWLSRKGVSRARYFRESPNGRCVALLIDRAPRGGPVRFRIARGDGSEDPRDGFIRLEGTKIPGNHSNVRCPCCNSVLPGTRKNPRTQSQLRGQHGGGDVIFDGRGRRFGGAQLLAVVTAMPGEQGRNYRLPTERDYQEVWKAAKRLEQVVASRSSKDPSPIPDEPLPFPRATGQRVEGAYFNFIPLRLYGLQTWGDLFTSRQKLALVTLARAVRELPTSSPQTVREAMALVIDRCADRLSTESRWHLSGQKIEGSFSRQALPMVWDFAEANPFSESTGGYDGALDWVAEVIEAWPGSPSGQTQIADATKHPLPSSTATVWFTDPPYYDAVPYADLSDFFFVWLKRTLPTHPLLRDRFNPENPLTPKSQEIIDDLELLRGVPKEKAKSLGLLMKDRGFYEEKMTLAFAEGRRILDERGIGCVVFAHKTTEGWEALLSGLVGAGWVVTASWPITTEMASRLRARNSAALSASVHLVIRPRPHDAPVGDWAEILRELPKRVGDWMERLQTEGIRGADLVFACIGPALEVFSQYSSVETAEGREVELVDYLGKVWEAVGRSALEQVLGKVEAQAPERAPVTLEEDARLTALFLWTYQTTDMAAEGNNDGDEEETDEEDEEVEEDVGAGRKTKGGYALPFDIVRRIAQPLGIHLDAWEHRVIETRKGVVTLLPLSERATQLFSGRNADAMAALARHVRQGPVQSKLIPEPTSSTKGLDRSKKESPEAIKPPRDTTTLDRVHTAMLLQAGGQSGALREFLEAETRRGPSFLRLANALSALYPKDSEDRRLIDAFLLVVPRG